jgi:hypothetical protein
MKQETDAAAQPVQTEHLEKPASVKPDPDGDSQPTVKREPADGSGDCEQSLCLKKEGAEEENGVKKECVADATGKGGVLEEEDVEGVLD